MAISSGAESTSSVTEMSRNKCGQIELPNASFVGSMIWRSIAPLLRGLLSQPTQSHAPTLPPRASAIDCNVGRCTWR
jgi:hypothetical protein